MADAPTPRPLPEPATDEKVRDLAEQFLASRVVSMYDVDPDLMMMVFLPLALGASQGWTEEQCSEIVLFGIHGRHHTTPWGVNGWPTFTECTFWRKIDYLKAAKLAHRMKEAQNAVPIEG